MEKCKGKKNHHEPNLQLFLFAAAKFSSVPGDDCSKCNCIIQLNAFAMTRCLIQQQQQQRQQSEHITRVQQTWPFELE